MRTRREKSVTRPSARSLRPRSTKSSPGSTSSQLRFISFAPVSLGHINKNRENDCQQTGEGGQRPQQVPLAGGDGEGGDNDRQLRSQHAIEKLLAPRVVALGGEIALTHLEFVQIGDRLVQAGLNFVP